MAHGVDDFAKATGTLTASGNFQEGETVTIGVLVYTFRAIPDAPYDVPLGNNRRASLVALAAAVNGTSAVEGTLPNPGASAVAGATNLVALAVLGGVFGNTIVTDTTAAQAAWSAALLEGGRGSVVDMLVSILRSSTTNSDVYQKLAAIMYAPAAVPVPGPQISPLDDTVETPVVKRGKK